MINTLSLPNTLFQLKSSSIANLELVHLDNPHQENPDQCSDTSDNDSDYNHPSQSNGYICNLCTVTFNDLPAQRHHFQSDWHIINLRRKLHKEPPLTEEQATLLISDSVKMASDQPDPDKSSSDDDDEVPPATQLSDYSKSHNDPYAVTKSHHTAQTLIGFRLVNQPDTLYTIYKSILPHTYTHPTTSSDLQTCLTNLFTNTQTSPVHVAYLMLGGGHFAGAFYSNDKCTTHTSIHRYTTRRKQGGSQSAQDGNRHASSAGANLRRYNEAQLAKDVWQLLDQWQGLLDRVHLVYIIAPGVVNRKTLFQHPNGCGLTKTDLRIRSVPFSTRRPAFKEIERIHKVLFSISAQAYIKPAVVEPVPSVVPAPLHKPPRSSPTQTELVNSDLLPRKKKKKRTAKPSSSQVPLPESSMVSSDEQDPNFFQEGSAGRASSNPNTNRLGSSSSSSVAYVSTIPSIVQDMSMLGLSEDARRRLEREQRARAAERRLGIQSPAIMPPKILNSAPSMRPACELVAESIASASVTKPAESSNGPPCTLCALCGILTGKSSVKRPNGAVYCSIKCAANAKRK